MNWKIIFAAGAILLSCTVYAQAPGGEDNWVPDLIGTWASEIAGYGFWDVTNPASELTDLESGDEFVQPFYIEDPGDRDIVITHQTGGAFAGEYGADEEEGDNWYKLTGIIMPDRTVIIQYYEPTGERHFITGRLTPSGGTLQISGYMQFFDDMHHTHPLWPVPFRDISESDKMMASLYIKLTKVD